MKNKEFKWVVYHLIILFHKNKAFKYYKNMRQLRKLPFHNHNLYVQELVQLFRILEIQNPKFLSQHWKKQLKEPIDTLNHLLLSIVCKSTNYKSLAFNLNWTMPRSPLLQVRKPRPFIAIEFRHDLFGRVTTNENNIIRQINCWIKTNSTEINFEKDWFWELIDHQIQLFHRKNRLKIGFWKYKFKELVPILMLFCELFCESNLNC